MIKLMIYVEEPLFYLFEVDTDWGLIVAGSIVVTELSASKRDPSVWRGTDRVSIPTEYFEASNYLKDCYKKLRTV